MLKFIKCLKISTTMTSLFKLKGINPASVNFYYQS